MCDVLWCHTTAEGAAIVWAALVGLLIGLATVGAAYSVGLRQALIMRDQTKIQKRQVLIAEHALDLELRKVNVDLFDKRFEVYEATRKFLSFILTHGNAPGWNLDVEGATTDDQLKLQADFSAAMDKSRFLFGSSVRRGLMEIWQWGDEIHWQTWADIEPREGESVAELETRNINTYVAFRKTMTNRLANLADVFGDELRLGGQVPILDDEEV
ncbi:hypothetical protein D3C71_1124740 [compost metagenome]